MMTNEIDNAVNVSLTLLDPFHTKPDEENYLIDGHQYKAPDHLMFGDKFIIERKGLNAVDNSQLYEKLKNIAASQGYKFVGYGIGNARKIIDMLLDPEKAARELVDYSNRKLMKHIRASNQKFEQHLAHSQIKDSNRIIIISDNRNWSEKTASTLQYICRKMGAFNKVDDETGLSDCIIYIKRPSYTIKSSKGGWFNILTKKKANQNQTISIKEFALSVCEKIVLAEPLYTEQKEHKHITPFWIDV